MLKEAGDTDPAGAAATKKNPAAVTKLAVELEPLRNFFSAEEYHQKYLDKNPGGYCHIPNQYFSMKK